MPISYILDKLTPNVVTVDVAENLAVRVSNQSEGETIAEVMIILRKIFGPGIPEPDKALVSKWSTDPLFRCAYTAYRTGVPENVFDYLLEPVNGCLYKWKNHFYEMKGDVGMSLHEKERNKKMPTPRHRVTHNPIPTSLFCFNMLFVCLL